MPRRALLIAVAALALAMTAFLFLQSRDATRGASQPAVEPGAAANAEAELAAAPLISDADAALQAAVAADAEREVVETDEAGAAAPAEAPARLAELRGRLLREDGSPVAGATLAVQGWGGNQERTLRFGEPEDWTDPTGTSDADGRFALRFDPPRAFQFVLDAQAPGLAEASWRWSGILPGEVKELGDVTLYTGGAVEVRIVDANGAALTGGWTVYVDSQSAREQGDGRDATRGRTWEAGADGAYRVEDMPPGPARVKAHSRIANWVEGPTVQVRAGETVPAEIAYVGPDNSRRITVVTFSRPFHVVDAEAESIHLFGLDGSERTAVHIPGSSQSNSFDDLPDGEYRVEIDDPRFLPWSQDGVRPGERVDARIRGSAALQVDVLDDAKGAAIPSWSARLRFENVRFSPREFELIEPGDEPPPGGLLDGIVPGDFTLFVRADGFAEGSATIDGLAAGETRSVVLRLGVPGAIAGVLRYGDGPPAPFVDVSLMPHEDEPEPPADEQMLGRWRMQQRDRMRQRRQGAVGATTDERGAFAFEGLAAGSYDLVATAFGQLTAERSAVAVAAGETTSVVLATPARCWLSGVCLVPDGVSLEGLRIEMQRAQGDDPGAPFGAKALSGEPDDGGAYRLGPVPPGSYAVRLRLPEVKRAMGPMVTTTPGPTRELETVTLVAGENAGHDFDLRESFPGRLRVSAQLGAEPAAEWRVRVFRVPAQDADEAASPLGRFAQESPGGVLDARGECVVGPLFPGDYVVVVEGASTSVVAPGVVAIPSAGEATLAIDARTYAGTLALLDATTGEPAADRPIKLRLPSPVPGVMIPIDTQRKTDADGRVALELAPGAYQVFDASNAFLSMFSNELAGVEVRWSPAGPAPAEALLPSAPSTPNPFDEGK